MEQSLGANIGRGIEVAVRSGAAPLLLGLRWAQRRREGLESRGLPSPRRTLALTSKVVLDEFFLATEFGSAALVSLGDHRRVSREITESVDFFEARGWLEAPEGYHRCPPPLRAAQFGELRSHGLPYRHLQFESGWEPHEGEPGRERWLGYEANRTAHAWLLEHAGAPRPWIVCVPGYRMGHPLVDFAGFRARWLHRRLGLNVAIPVLPLHGPRRVGRRGGDGFLTGDFVDTVHAQAQAVWDVRRLVRFLRQREATGVGVHGVSLGGYTTALLASLEDDLDCVVAGIPAVDFLRLMRSHTPGFVLRAAAWAGFPWEHIERLLHVVSPLAMAPRVAHGRRYLYAGLADRLATPEHARDLWHHWGRPRMAWYEGSHVSFLWESGVASLLHEAFSRSGLLTHAPIPESGEGRFGTTAAAQ